MSPLKIESSSVLLCIKSPVPMIGPAHSWCLVSIGWKNDYFNQWSTSVWETSESFKNYSKVTFGPLISEWGYDYTTDSWNTAPNIDFASQWLYQRSGAICGLYLFLYSSWAKNGFYGWTFEIDLMLGNTNFEPQWNKILSRKNISTPLIRSVSQKMCAILLNFINKNVETCPLSGYVNVCLISLILLLGSQSLTYLLSDSCWKYFPTPAVEVASGPRNWDCLRWRWPPITDLQWTQSNPWDAWARVFPSAWEEWS